jgi:tetratricopeptide (TPR) repeat protein
MNPAVSTIDIGDACLCQGDYYRALERYFPVLKTQEKDPAANPLATASICYCIGSSYDHLDRSSDALHYYLKALVIIENILGQYHPETAKIYRSVARIYGSWGYDYMLWNCDDEWSYMFSDMSHLFSFDNVCHDCFEPAINYYNKALACYQSITPPDEAAIKEVNEALQALAVKKEEENRFALDNYFKVMEIRKWYNGEDSIRMAEILYCIGVVYSNMNDEEKAKGYYRKSYEIFQSSGLLLSQSLNSNP